MKHLYFLLIIILLSGCITDYSSLIASRSEICEEIGFKKNTNDFKNCVLQMVTTYENGRAGKSSAVLTGIMINPNRH